LRAHLKQIRIREMEERDRRGYELIPETQKEIHMWGHNTAWLED
jgi:hypothetical protein